MSGFRRKTGRLDALEVDSAFEFDRRVGRRRAAGRNAALDDGTQLCHHDAQNDDCTTDEDSHIGALAEQKDGKNYACHRNEGVSEGDLRCAGRGDALKPTEGFVTNSIAARITPNGAYSQAVVQAAMRHAVKA